MLSYKGFRFRNNYLFNIRGNERSFPISARIPLQNLNSTFKSNWIQQKRTTFSHPVNGFQSPWKTSNEDDDRSRATGQEKKYLFVYNYNIMIM